MQVPGTFTRAKKSPPKQFKRSSKNQSIIYFCTFLYDFKKEGIFNAFLTVHFPKKRFFKRGTVMSKKIRGKITYIEYFLTDLKRFQQHEKG